LIKSFAAGGQSNSIRSANRERHPHPTNSGRYLGEYDAGLNAAVATLGALYWQMASGFGQWIDISKQESVAALERVTLTLYPNGEKATNSEDKQVILNPPWKLSETPTVFAKPSPLLGEHNDYVFGTLLGMQKQDITKLTEEIIIY